MMLCPHCGSDVRGSEPGEPCPTCGNELSAQAGQETDMHGGSTKMLGEATYQPPAARVAQSEAESPTLPAFPEKPKAAGGPLHPDVNDSYVPFAGSIGATKIVNKQGGGASNPQEGAETKTDFTDDKTAILSGDKKPVSRISAPAASRAPIPSIPKASTASHEPMAESDVRRRSAAPTAPRPDDELAYQFLGPEGINALMGKTIGGFLIKKKLGQGGMGAVCLARQLSLDRDVALKILPGHFAVDPDFVARFTREALSAAQLNHHNVIQVHDVGEDHGVHFIAMEFVSGDNLGSMTRRDGKISVEDATGYVLQAARGLKYAHDRGVIHRDIKPDNLMLNEHGIVKIADMGLAKIRGQVERSHGLDTEAIEELKNQAYSELTMANVAMGTPAYMAPEQGRDASTVDHRADQYSLGCTLYYLIAGKAPFSGKTTFEVISKHLSEPVIPIETIVKNVPRELSFIIEKMLSKNPAERYPSLREAIEALEAYLGISSAQGAYTPREHHVAILEKEQLAYYSAATLKLRRLATMGFFALFVVLFLVAAAMGSFIGAAAMACVLLLTPIFNFIAHGFLTKEFLFRRLRAVSFGMPLKKWAMVIGAAVAAALVAFLTGLHFPLLIAAIVSAGIVAAYQIALVRKLKKEREGSLASVQEMLKQLRVRGVDEDAIQDFVCRFSGAKTRGHWEEFFEELFGYEAMIAFRNRQAARDKAHARKRFATWRDPLARWLDEVEVRRRKAHEEKQLAKAEKERLKAGGMDEAAAETEAKKIAQEAVDVGLLQKTTIISAPPTKAEIEKIDRELHAMRSRPGIVSWVFRGVRLAFGFFVLACAGALAARTFGVTVPDALQGIIRATYYKLVTLGDPSGSKFYVLNFGAIPAVVAGLLVLLTAFSKRLILPTLVLVGAVVHVFHGPISLMVGQAQPMFTPWIAYLLGLLVCILSFGAMILGKITGGKF
ncbi:protein kinase [Candidatus Sumerlaeota bacterium]|nr:protein kinase [Candidatus Sumerlaeota bacterium]